MRYLPDGKQMKEADRHTIEDLGVPSLVLMERAALKTVETMEKRGIDTSKALIVCGSGNNGGDGFAAARILTEKGRQADIVFAGKESSMSEECRVQKQIAEKSCRRTYLALLEGNLKDDRGVISTYIGRNPNDRVKMAVVDAAHGKYAVTEYDVIGRSLGYTFCRFVLQTGRTHQIRVHAKHIGHPIVGDDVYGRKKREFGLNGQLLHACRLELTHPSTGERMTFEAPLPDYFVAVLKKLKFDGFC